MSKKINKFWNFSELKENGEETQRVLRIDGVIAEESWCGDEVTPKEFKAELESKKSDITVWINSLGGDVFAASEIYTMLRNYQGKVTVKIDGLAASSASVIAMAGDEVLMSPLSLIMVHDPMTASIGNVEEMQKAIEMLSEVKESIINAYQAKTKLSRKKISYMMSAETWLNARKAVEMGFADGILFEDKDEIFSKRNQYSNLENLSETNLESFIFSRMAVTNSILDKFKRKSEEMRYESQKEKNELRKVNGELSEINRPQRVNSESEESRSKPVKTSSELEETYRLQKVNDELRSDSENSFEEIKTEAVNIELAEINSELAKSDGAKSFEEIKSEAINSEPVKTDRLQKINCELRSDSENGFEEIKTEEINIEPAETKSKLKQSQSKPAETSSKPKEAQTQSQETQVKSSIKPLYQRLDLLKL